MNIGIIIGRIGGVDGVALETEKWIEVLHRIGHKTFIISGQYQERKMNPDNETLVPEMSFFSPESFWEQKKAFFHPDTNIEELLEHIELYSNIITQKVIKWTNKHKIDVLISENASALPSHIAMGLGIKNAVELTETPTITHDHDFGWERGERYVSPHKIINEYVADIFPLRSPFNVHAVINTNAQTTLKEKFARDSVNVPNVMDFNMPFGIKTDRNKHLKRDLGLEENSILLFQITRIVSRKAIDVAIRLVHRLQDERVKLIITGGYADDEGSAYYNKMLTLIHELKVSIQVIFAHHLINNKGLLGGDPNLYCLSDAYANANACTYFSTYEGFGNAFVEAVLAKVPIFVNNYKPVYWPDIGSKGFKTVMLEDNNLTDDAVKQMKEIICDEKKSREIAEYNFQLGKKYFSYDTLEEKLTELIDKALALKS